MPPQLFYVLSCFDQDRCGQFQVQQATKTNKWTCKVCGQKQSVLKIHFQSHAAKDCRPLVQEWNARRLALREQQDAHEMLANVPERASPEPGLELEPQQVHPRHSKWDCYVSTADASQQEEEIVMDLRVPPGGAARVASRDAVSVPKQQDRKRKSTTAAEPCSAPKRASVRPLGSGAPAPSTSFQGDKTTKPTATRTTSSSVKPNGTSSKWSMFQ